MTTKSKTVSLDELFRKAPRYQALVEDRDAQFMGPCVVQASGAWTRIGPTWLVPGIGWLVVGPGVANWGTKKGLAELATEVGPSPSWHAVGLIVAPQPNLVFAVTANVLESAAMVEVASLTAEAEVFNAQRS